MLHNRRSSGNETVVISLWNRVKITSRFKNLDSKYISWRHVDRSASGVETSLHLLWEKRSYTWEIPPLHKRDSTPFRVFCSGRYDGNYFDAAQYRHFDTAQYRSGSYFVDITIQSYSKLLILSYHQRMLVGILLIICCTNKVVTRFQAFQ